MKEETLKAIDAVVRHQTRKITSLQSTVADYAAERTVLLDALRALVDKLDVVLPICDSYIAVQSIRSGTKYTGPNIVKELAEARALLAERKEKEHAE